jgi:CheY-like chemotaxis protein
MAAIKILIVEDELIIAKGLARKLEKLEYVVVGIASSSVSALEKVTETQPDLILMDLKMPNMDGFETCRLLRADPEFADISIVVVSGFVSDQDRVRALEAGADDFIGKP